MDLLKTLKFVQGGVSKKTMLPELNHFLIEKGRVSGYNGNIALSCPIECDLDCSPKALLLTKAIESCEEAVQLSRTPTGLLRVVSGGFRALVPCIDRELPPPQPQGLYIEVNGEALLAGLKAVAPFVGDDASRPWSNGVLFRDQSLYATNNVVVVQRWIGFDLPYVVNVPGKAIDEVLRIKEVPIGVQVDNSTITFHYESGSWIRSNLYATDWPDVSRLLDKPHTATAIDERIFDALTKLKKFVDPTMKVYFGGGRTYTHANTQDEGSSYELPGSNMQGIYALDMLMLLKGVATTADFSAYPEACLFFGDCLRGAIIGRKS